MYVSACLCLCVQTCVSDVHHEHDQDEEQSFGKACAVFGDSVRRVSRGAEAGVRIP